MACNLELYRRGILNSMYLFIRKKLTDLLGILVLRYYTIFVLAQIGHINVIQIEYLNK